MDLESFPYFGHEMLSVINYQQWIQRLMFIEDVIGKQTNIRN